VVLHEAIGQLRPEVDSTPLGHDSIFPVASTSKTITAATVMRLVDEGAIGLNRRLIDYIPELQGAGVEAVLIAHLLTHTSGFDDVDWDREVRRAADAGEAPPEPEPDQHPDVAAAIATARNVPLFARPGSAFRYSNLNYNILGELVHRAGGAPLETLSEEFFFGPLGMADSFFVLPPEQRERRVIRPQGSPGTDSPVTTMAYTIDSEEHDAQPFGSGGFMTSARDLGVFAQMLLNGGAYGSERVLSRASVATMSRPQVGKDVPATLALTREGEDLEIELEGWRSGFGLFVLEDDRTPYFNGSLPSQSTYGHAGYGGSTFWVDPERELVGVYLSASPRWMDEAETMFDWRADIFQNMVTATVED
jgi:CubicO group peptidase (beta-lactamase class C family)